MPTSLRRCYTAKTADFQKSLARRVLTAVLRTKPDLDTRNRIEQTREFCSGTKAGRDLWSFEPF
jgi:hypothetical protein